MKKIRKTGIPAAGPGMGPGMGGMMGGPPKMRPPMMRPPMMTPPTTRPPVAPIRRPPVMKTKGMPLAGFAPGPKKSKKGKKIQKRLAI